MAPNKSSYSEPGFVQGSPAMADQKAERGKCLPPTLPPRGLSRVQAAAYVGVSSTLFDELVADGRMPKPKRINTRTVWDIRKLDIAFDAIPDEQDRNPWDGEAR